MSLPYIAAMKAVAAGAMIRPAVSVLLAVHNQAHWLPGALDDVLGQTWEDLELIAVDDGSNDGSAEVLAGRRDARLRWFRLPRNVGLTRALNFAIQQARGAWLARQDADDRSSNDRLAIQMAYLARHPDCVLLGSDASLIDEAGRPLASTEWSRPLDHEPIREQLLAGENPIVHGSAVMRADVVRRLGGYRPFRFAQDYDLWLRISRHFRVANLADRLYLHRVHGGQISQEQAVAQRRYSLTAAVLHAWPGRRDATLSARQIESALTPRAVAGLTDPVRRHWANWFLTWLIDSEHASPREIIAASTLALMLDPRRLRTWRAVASAAWRRLKAGRLRASAGGQRMCEAALAS